MRRSLVGLLALALAVPATSATAALGASGRAPATAGDYLDQLVKRSPAPEYRRSSTAGVGAIVQGATQRNLFYALRLRPPGIPVVVSVVPDTIVGQAVTLRAMGSPVHATSHNVVGVLPPPAGSTQYVALTAHMDGWFQAAADNGGGAAAVLRAADLLAAQHPSVGVLIW